MVSALHPAIPAHTAADPCLFLSHHRCSLCPSSASTLPPNQWDADIARARRLTLAALETEDGWVSFATRGGISIFTKDSANSPLKSTKGVGVCNSPALLVFSLLGDCDHRCEWDPMLESARVLRVVDRLTRVAYSVFKTKWPISRREMVVVGRGQREDDGSLLSFATTVQYPELPVPSGSLRATLQYWGVRLTPLTATSCRFEYVACSDPLGSLPTRLVNLASMLQPMTIARIDKLLQSRPQLREEIYDAMAAASRAEGLEPVDPFDTSSPRNAAEIARAKRDAAEEKAREDAVQAIIAEVEQTEGAEGEHSEKADSADANDKTDTAPAVEKKEDYDGQ